MDYALIVIAFLMMLVAAIYALIVQKRAHEQVVSENGVMINRVVEINKDLIRMNESILDRLFASKNLPPMGVNLTVEHEREQKAREDRRETAKVKPFSLNEARNAEAAKEQTSNQ